MMMGRWREGVRAAVEVQVGLEEDRQALCLHRSRASESFGGTGPGPQSVRSTSTSTFALRRVVHQLVELCFLY